MKITDKGLMTKSTRPGSSWVCTPWDSFMKVRLKGGQSVTRYRLKITEDTPIFTSHWGLGLVGRRGDIGRTYVADKDPNGNVVDYLVSP